MSGGAGSSLQRALRRVVDVLQRSLFEDDDGNDGAVAAPPVSTVVPAVVPVTVPVVEPIVAPGPAGARAGDRRESLLHGRRVAWRLRRSRRRSIGFQVGDDGLVVTAPMRTPLREIEAALGEKSGWIVARLDEQHDRAARREAGRIVWRDGVEIPFLGAPLVVVLDAGAGLAPGRARHRPAADGRRAELRIGLPADAAPERLRDAAQSWLQREAMAIFEARCRHFEARLGVRVTRLTLSSAATRWGSATAAGAVRLHWRLVHFAPATIDYVVAHELAHLREMNHGERFWRTVRSVVDDCDAVRDELRRAELPGW